MTHNENRKPAYHQTWCKQPANKAYHTVLPDLHFLLNRLRRSSHLPATDLACVVCTVSCCLFITVLCACSHSFYLFMGVMCRAAQHPSRTYLMQNRSNFPLLPALPRRQESPSPDTMNAAVQELGSLRRSQAQVLQGVALEVRIMHRGQRIRQFMCHTWRMINFRRRGRLRNDRAQFPCNYGLLCGTWSHLHQES